VQECRVYFRDRLGIEHGVPVNAVNRYHAFGLALVAMRKCTWSNPDYSGVEKMTVQILGGEAKGRRVVVTREQFEKWVMDTTMTLKDQREREYCRMLLGREQPSRDFKRGMTAR
jgi:hypothetical protein